MNEMHHRISSQKNKNASQNNFSIYWFFYGWDNS